MDNLQILMVHRIDRHLGDEVAALQKFLETVNRSSDEDLISRADDFMNHARNHFALFRDLATSVVDGDEEKARLRAQVDELTDTTVQDEMKKLQDEIKNLKGNAALKDTNKQPETDNVAFQVSDNELTARIEELQAEIKRLNDAHDMEKNALIATIDELDRKAHRLQNTTTDPGHEQDAISREKYENMESRFKEVVRELAKYGPTRAMVRIRAEPEASKDKLLDISNPTGGPWKCLRLTALGENQAGNPTKTVTDYQFEHVFGPNESNSDVFEAVKNFTASAMQCASVNIVGYGQTGSGKSHTFFGTNADPGIIQRHIHDHFELTEVSVDGFQYEFSVSAVEFYLGKMYDLLDQRGSNIGKWADRETRPFQDPEEAAHILETIVNKRQTASTRRNVNSSRSTLFVSIAVNKRLPNAPEAFCLSPGTVNFIDLAGSERTEDSQNQGETNTINQDISEMGQAIRAFANGDPVVLRPQSVLVRAFREYLGVDARLLYIGTTSPLLSNVNASKPTLALGNAITENRDNALIAQLVKKKPAGPVPSAKRNPQTATGRKVPPQTSTGRKIPRSGGK
ncbi:P-loop containing nucleoside triphosphate hydrolase protein [Xylariaceae sp. FL1272]|nr:P-loop containing nucleoside triphosphate hydrolase protein [Xylariaceae sp. FL1272]